MEIDPVESADAHESSANPEHARLNTWVAITVALLATFMGICKVKDDNIVQAMQQAQADKSTTGASTRRETSGRRSRKRR